MDFATLDYTDADGNHSVKLDADSTSIGRSAGQNIVLRDAIVSRQHAVITRENRVYLLLDQKSSHGTFLNGVRIEQAILKSGDLLQFGSLEGPRLLFTFDAFEDRKPLAHTTMIGSLLSSISQFPRPDKRESPAAGAMEQLNWLLSAARQLNSGGAVEDVLSTLLQLTLQLTGQERGFVFLRRDGEMRLAQGLTAEGHAVVEDSTISRRAIQKAIESDQKFSISDTHSDESASGWASVAVNKIRSIYCIPLRKLDATKRDSELLGLLYLDSQLRAGSMSEIDHQLLDTISTEAASLVRNALLAEAESIARRAKEELAIAARIHSGLMSIAMPVMPFAEVKARSIPCYEIGGDFFDAVLLEDCVCVTIADVSGKGVPAAIVAATVEGIIHAQLLSGQSLPEIASLLNKFLCARNVGKYATMVVLKLYSDGRVEYMNCGHIPPLLIQDAKISWLEESNLIVGLLPGVSYSSAHCTLQPGERILLVTDGLTEAENCAGDQFGESGLVEVVRELDIDGLLDHVAKFQEHCEAQDDCTLVEVRYTGGPQASARILLE